MDENAKSTHQSFQKSYEDNWSSSTRFIACWKISSGVKMMWQICREVGIPEHHASLSRRYAGFREISDRPDVSKSTIKARDGSCKT